MSVLWIALYGAWLVLEKRGGGEGVALIAVSVFRCERGGGEEEKGGKEGGGTATGV